MLLTHQMQIRHSNDSLLNGQLICYLQLFTELRETFYLLDHWFIIKDITQNSQMEEVHKEGAQSFHAPLDEPLSRHLHVPTNPEVL